VSHRDIQDCVGSAVPVLEKEFGMSHQDKAAGIVVDHQAIKHVFDWLLRPALFVGTKVRGGAS
jgi:hypothetical protein